MDPYTAAILQIEAADLPSTVYRTARRLLDSADPQHGHARLTKDQIMSAAGTDAYNTARAHLVKLQQKNVIHYSVNGDIYINFSSFGRALSDHPRALSDHIEGNCKDERALSDHPRALSDHITYGGFTSDRSAINVIAERSPVIAQRSHSPIPIGYWLVGTIDPTTSPNGTNQLVGASAKTETEQQAAFELLNDPDLLALVSQRDNHAEKTRIYAREHDFVWLIQTIGTFFDQYHAGKARTVGALYNRIENNWTPEPITDAFRRTEIYKRHYPLSRADAEARERRRRYTPDAIEPDPLLDALPAPIWE